MPVESIEILSLEFFNTLKKEIRLIERVKESLKMDIGWHYYLDLAWIIKNVTHLPRGALILDAGAGAGLAQFILAEMGYNVISSDFSDRSFLKERFDRYKDVMHYLNEQSKDFVNRYTKHLNKVNNISTTKHTGIFKKYWQFFGNKGRNQPISKKDLEYVILKNRYIPKEERSGDIMQKDVLKNCGRIFLYKCDVKDMSELPDDFVDAVVSVSALEHNDHRDFEKCIGEILRVTKPGGILAITVSASQGEDWFHEHSKGWCYSENTLKKLFELPKDIPSNYFDKERLFGLLKKENNELHKRLSPSYYKSGNNGMPWGKWDPKYQSVGISKIKSI